MKRVFGLFLATGLVLSLCSCGGSETPSQGGGNKKTETTKISVSSVSLSATSLTLKTGESQTLTATVSPSNATNSTVSWSSSDASVATVSGGKVTAVAAGTATITATADGKSATCKVTVEDPVVAVSSVTLSVEDLSLAVGETATLTATVSPEDATYSDVTWTTSDDAVATVAGGVVTAVAGGVATITATADGVSATCAVTVSEAYEGWWSVSDVTVNECQYQTAINNNKSILANYCVLVKKANDEEAYAYLFDESTSAFKYAFAGKIKSSTCIGDSVEESKSITVLGKTVTTVTTFEFEFDLTGNETGTLSCIYKASVNGIESTLADVLFDCEKSGVPSGYVEGSEESVEVSSGVPSIDDIKSLLGK